MVYSVAFSPDGSTIASASKDNTVRLWSREGEAIRTLVVCVILLCTWHLSIGGAHALTDLLPGTRPFMLTMRFVVYGQMR